MAQSTDNRSSRRQFLGTGLAITAVSAGVPALADRRPVVPAGASAIGAFVYQAGHAGAIDAGRVAALQGLTVVPFAVAQLDECLSELRSLWQHDPVNVVGLTTADGFDHARELAAGFGFELCHAAEAGSDQLVHWIIGPGEPGRS